MHLLIVHQNFADYGNPGGTRHLELARHLVAQGHRCTIIAGSVDFMSGQPLPRVPTTLAGVNIRRAYALPTVHHSYLGRALSYASFMVTSLWEGLRVGAVDAVMGTSPPIFQLPSAWAIARLRGRPFILEIRDLWPDFAVQMGVLRHRWLIGLARQVERFFYAHQDMTVINSPGFRDHMLQRGVAPRQLQIIPNGVETSMFQPEDRGALFRERWGLRDQFVVMYAGSLGLANDLNTLLQAASQLRDLPEVRIVIAGMGKERSTLQREVERLQLTNVVLAGHFPKSQVADVLAAADVCVATLQDVTMFRTVYPNKVFDYMAAGRPTIVAIDGVIRQVIEDGDAGTFVSPGDATQLASAVRRYRDDPQRCQRQGQAARRYVSKHFERADQAGAFQQALERLTATHRPTLYERWIKRPLDLLLTIPMAILAAPLIAVAYWIVKRHMGSPAIFRQARAGRHGRVFTLYKFRTMRDAHDQHGQPLSDEQRLTAWGRRLRSWSLDELPQLWNILRGDMSLIGPRPLLERYLDRYTPAQARRHEVRPGITGWAQVNGRNAISWDEKFKLDVWYVDHCRFLVDLHILWRTIASVLFKRGISSDGHVTMPEFTGEPASSLTTSSQETTPS